MKSKIKLLKALADDTRMSIIQQLLDGEQCACAIVPAVGKAQSTVSGHLRILEEADVLESRKVGSNVWYGIKSDNTRKILSVLNINKVKTNKQC